MQRNMLSHPLIRRRRKNGHKAPQCYGKMLQDYKHIILFGPKLVLLGKNLKETIKKKKPKNMCFRINFKH